jgi:hypothetical protein
VEGLCSKGLTGSAANETIELSKQAVPMSALQSMRPFIVVSFSLRLTAELSKSIFPVPLLCQSYEEGQWFMPGESVSVERRFRHSVSLYPFPSQSP